MEQFGGGAGEGRLGGKVVVVTGGARGIGGATARVAAQQGASVVIGDVLAAEGEDTAAAITAEGGRCLFVRADVSQEQDCARLMAAAVEHFGRLDALIACAGILWGAFQDVDELDLDTFEHVMDANVQGMFLSVKHAAPHIKAGGGGVILCLSSGAGVRGGSSSVAYGTSKAAVHGLTYVVQPQLAPHNIRVHAICPGGIATPLKLQNVADGARSQGLSPEEAVANVRLGDPIGIGKILAWLISDEADYVRGTVFTR